MGGGKIAKPKPKQSKFDSITKYTYVPLVNKEMISNGGVLKIKIIKYKVILSIFFF